MKRLFAFLLLLAIPFNCGNVTIDITRVIARKNAITTTPPSWSDGQKDVASNSTSWDTTYPAAVENNDIALAYFQTETPGNATGTPPSGWTKLDETDTSDATTVIYWRRCDGTEDAQVDTWTSLWDAGERGVSFIATFSGCVTSGSPIDASDYSSSASGTSKSLGAITTTTANTLIVAAMGTDPGSSGQTCAWDSPATERVDSDITPSGDNGTLGIVWIATAPKVAAGSQTITATLSASEVVAESLIALLPE